MALNRFLFFWLLLLTSVLSKSIQGASSTTREMAALQLTQGEQRLLQVPNLLRYSKGSQKIRILPLSQVPVLSGASNKESLLIKGLEIGSTDLWVWKSDGSIEHRVIHILKSSQDLKNQRFEKALEGLRETEVIYSGTQVILRGEIKSLLESSHLAALLSGYSKEILDYTQISQSLLNQGQTHIEDWLKASGYSNRLRVEKIGNQIWVRGSIERPAEIHGIRKQIHSIFPLALIEIETLPNYSPTIYFRVFLLEFRKSLLKNLGIFWGANSLQSIEFGQDGVQSLFKLDLTLHHLEGSGLAKILSSPELVVRAPGEAELFSGGEFPISTQSRYASNVNWKKFGLTLKLKVTHFAGNQVRLDILTEVSHLDLKNGNDAIPGVQANRMTTQVDAILGTPLLLSGLLQDKIREESKGFPLLQNLPVLGKLFGSEDFLNERSELVAILYPQMAPPRGLLKRARQLFQRQPFENQENYPWDLFQ